MGNMLRRCSSFRPPDTGATSRPLPAALAPFATGPRSFPQRTEQTCAGCFPVAHPAGKQAAAFARCRCASRNIGHRSEQTGSPVLRATNNAPSYAVMFAVPSPDRGLPAPKTLVPTRFANHRGWAPTLDGSASSARMSLIRKQLEWFYRNPPYAARVRDVSILGSFTRDGSWFSKKARATSARPVPVARSQGNRRDKLRPRDRQDTRFAPPSRRAAPPIAWWAPKVLARFESGSPLSHLPRAQGCWFSSCFSSL
jgi:hypothetical protein